MKGLKKVALASAIAAVSAGAQAELKALDDSAMGELTGQAGLTIDVETKYTIGEFAYHDYNDGDAIKGGFVALQGISMGGHGASTVPGKSDYLDNFRMIIDVAGAGEELTYGMSELRGLAGLYVANSNADTRFGALATGVDSLRGEAVDAAKTYNDGDLVIHFGFTDAWDASSAGSFAAYNAAGRFNTDDYLTAETIASQAVDFKFGIDLIGIADSTHAIGESPIAATDHATGIDTDTSNTALFSDLSIQGYFGPEDLHIENNGNGFGADGSGLGGAAGTGNADSKITWGSYFKITDLDVYIDIAGVQIKDLRIHNERGDRTGIDGTSSFDFAHSIREIYAVKDTVLHVEALATGGNPFQDGIALNTEFKGDIDIEHLSFGNTDKSIGQIFITDMHSDTNWTISAH